MQTTIRLHSLPFTSPATYFAALAFIAGNILLPQLVHLIPQGGIIWLPIYFFTLVGAYKYGWRTGLLTALASGGKPEDILAGALPPEASGLFGLLNNRASSPSRRSAPGLSAVSHFAPPDILGTLYKLMA